MPLFCFKLVQLKLKNVLKYKYGNSDCNVTSGNPIRFPI